MVEQLAEHRRGVDAGGRQRAGRVLPGAGEAGVVGEQRRPQPAAGAVRGDDEVDRVTGGVATPVPTRSADPPVRPDARDRRPGAHRPLGQRRDEQPVQPRPVDHHQRRPRPGRDLVLVDGQQRAPAPVAQAAAGRERRRPFADRAAQTERVERADPVGQEPDARAGLAQDVRALVHRHRVPGPVGGDRRGQPAEPRPDHHDVHAGPYPLHV